LLKTGDLAPDFTLPSTLQKDISLADFRGNKNVLVAFYPLDFTPG
jgi:peroxiredoxin